MLQLPKPKSSADTGWSNLEFLSVREAAMCLGVSASTVYRLDREHGPFRIEKRRGRVLVDRKDFDRHTAINSNQEQSTIATEVPEPTPVTFQGSSVEQPATSAVSHGTGQRELILPHRGPFVVIYATWI